MDKFFLKDSIILNSNMQVFNQWVFPALTYGAETWTLRNKLTRCNN